MKAKINVHVKKSTIGVGKNKKTADQLYKEGMHLANSILDSVMGLYWDDLPDNISLWECIGEFADTNYEWVDMDEFDGEHFFDAVREACICRFEESDYGNRKEQAELIEEMEQIAGNVITD